jgi:DNA-binding transcriptional LysR family regulator
VFCSTAHSRERLPVHISQGAIDMTTALGMAAAGLGVAILPDAAITSASAAIRRVPIRQPVLTWRIEIITRSGRSLPPRRNWSRCSACRNLA